MAHLNLMHTASSPKKADYYSGQWTKEEQDYVTCLMEGFKLGTLDIPDGTSLRFFIAAKLGCKPKRVSKKYERSGYNGKQVYRKDSNAKDVEAYRQRLTDCEQKFKESRALVVSMQEAKTESKPTLRETPIISLSSNHQSNHALEDRLAAMRSQIDRTATMLSMGGQHHHQHQSPALSSSMNMNRFNPMLGAGAGNPFNPAPMSSLEMRQALLFQQQQQQRQRAAAAMGGFSTGLPSAGLGMSFPHSSSPAGPTNKLMIDLYQRRQQLIMANMMGGGAAGPSSAASMPFMGVAPTPATAMGEKRDLEDLEGEEQARKRARPAAA